jgi:hypothetical protein
LRDVVAEATRTLLEGICLFAAPYIVWRSASKKEDEPPDDERGGGLSVEAAG